MSREYGKVYLHVGNSGLQVSVKDEGFGPMVVFHTSAFGNLQTTMEVHTTQDGLRQIGEMLIAAADRDGYSDVYCHAAEPLYDREERTHSGEKGLER